MKDFIIDDGKVRRCTSNEAKMNIPEWIYYYHSFFISNITDTIKQFYEGLTLLMYGTINLIVIILFPITFPYAAYKNIKRARKEMIHLQKYNRKGE